MNRSMVVKIAIVATVTVGDMATLSHPCNRGIYTSMYCRCRRRALRDEFMACRRGNNGNSSYTPDDKLFSFGGKKAFSQMNSSMVVKIVIVATVTF